MRRYQSLLEPGSISQAGMAHSDFEFPVPISVATPHDVVFCGKVITRQSEPGPPPPPQKPKSSGRTSGFFSRVRSSSSGMENRYQKISSSRKHYNGMFGAVKFPLQMELSDMKMRQERMEKPLPKLPAMEENNGGESCWELIRPLRRRGMLVRALAKASLCVPIV